MENAGFFVVAMIIVLGSLAALLFFIIWLCHRIADTYHNIAQTRHNTQKQLELLFKKREEEKKEVGTNLCENCGSIIGKLQQAFVYKEHIVCKECNEKLLQESKEK